MVTQGILELVLFLVSPIVEKFPDISIDIGNSALGVVLEWVNGVLYFLPMNTVATILALMLATQVVRLIVAILKTIWGILPLV